MTEGLSSAADYVLRLHAGGPPKDVPTSRPASPAAAELIDTADLDGFATITNLSGVTYENAQLKLMAGDLNILHPDALPQGGGSCLFGSANSAADDKSFQEKPFFEYHLYTLVRPATLRDNETKQIDLVSGKGMKNVADLRVRSGSRQRRWQRPQCRPQLRPRGQRVGELGQRPGRAAAGGGRAVVRSG